MFCVTITQTISRYEPHFDIVSDLRFDIFNYGDINDCKTKNSELFK